MNVCNISIILKLALCRYTVCNSFVTEDWLPGGLAVLSWEHWCHHADNQSDPKGQWFFSFCALIHPSANLFCLMNYSYVYLFLSQDLSSPNQYDTGVALTGLSCFVTPDLARDLANDIMTLVSHGECVKRFTNKDCSVVPPQLILCIYLPQLFAVKGVTPFLSLLSVFLHHRCPTLNLTSERKQYWSCTRCFWSTQSPSVLLSPGSRRNWRTQTQVLGKNTAWLAQQAFPVTWTLWIIHQLRIWN